MIEPQISFHPDHYFQKAESLTMLQPDITDGTDGSDRMTVRDDHLPPYIGDFRRNLLHPHRMKRWYKAAIKSRWAG
mgnify:CR=1 FL=1